MEIFIAVVWGVEKGQEFKAEAEVGRNWFWELQIFLINC